LNVDLAEKPDIWDTFLRSYFDYFLHPMNQREFSTSTVYLMGLMYYISNKLTNTLWNFLDVFIIVMCRLMSFRFTTTNNSLQYKGESNTTESMILGHIKTISKPRKYLSNPEWDNLLREYELLQNITKQLNRLISPFLLCSYIL